MTIKNLTNEDVLKYIKAQYDIANGELGEDTMLAQAFLDDVEDIIKGYETRERTINANIAAKTTET